jgi:hypothetical protein
MSDLTKVEPQQIEERHGREEVFADLRQMLDNWCAGYLRLLDEGGIDWSAPHCFFEEFFHMMCPFIDRLHRTGNTTRVLMKGIGDKLVETMIRIVEKCQQEEDLLRLTGGWTDAEQEIKEYWEEEIAKLTKSCGARLVQNGVDRGTCEIEVES